MVDLKSQLEAERTARSEPQEQFSHALVRFAAVESELNVLKTEMRVMKEVENAILKKMGYDEIAV